MYCSNSNFGSQNKHFSKSLYSKLSAIKQDFKNSYFETFAKLKNLFDHRNSSVKSKDLKFAFIVNWGIVHLNINVGINLKKYELFIDF